MQLTNPISYSRNCPKQRCEPLIATVQISVVIHMSAHATVYQVKNSFVRISNISPIFSHFKLVFSYVTKHFVRMLSKLVCRSLSRISMITNIDCPVQTNFTIHVHIFAVYSCPQLHFIDPININRAKHFFHIFFRGLPF